MSASTRARVAAATSVRPFSTRETVGNDTPASLAMVAIVARPGLGERGADSRTSI
jgi:hypothetical protein